MIAAALAAFNLFGTTTRLIMIVGFVLSLVTAGGVIYYKIWDRGYEYALAAIAKRDAKAIAKATSYRGAVDDCDSRKLLWDQSTGKCVGE